MKKAHAILALLVFFGIFAQANAAKDFVFSVISIKGNLEVQRGGKGSWEKLKVASKVFKTDKIRLQSNSTANLAHSSGKTLQLTDAKEYTPNQLEQTISSQKSSVGAKLAKSVLDEVYNAESALKSGNYKKNTSVTGAGERGLFFIKVDSPRKIHFKQNEITFKWFKTDMSGGYKVFITDVNDMPIYSIMTEDTVLSLDISKLNLKKDVYYFWYVAQAGDTTKRSENISFKALPEKKLQSIMENVEAIKKELNADDSAFLEIVLARYYENNYLIEEADNAYKAALEIAPDVPEYKAMYRIFVENSFQLK
jgi:hypothetical protein